MSSKTYALLVAMIFTLVAIVQLARATVAPFPVIVAGHEIPASASWIAVAVAGLLALLGYTARK